MKFLIVAALIACVAFASGENVLKLSEEQRTRVHGYSTECIEKEGVTKEAVEELKSGNFAKADDKLKGFTNCFLEKVGFLVDGVPQVEVINTKLVPLVGEAEVKAIGEKCNGLKGDSTKDTAFKFYECYFTNHASYL